MIDKNQTIYGVRVTSSGLTGEHAEKVRETVDKLRDIYITVIEVRIRRGNLVFLVTDMDQDIDVAPRDETKFSGKVVGDVGDEVS